MIVKGVFMYFMTFLIAFFTCCYFCSCAISKPHSRLPSFPRTYVKPPSPKIPTSTKIPHTTTSTKPVPVIGLATVVPSPSTNVLPWYWWVFMTSKRGIEKEKGNDQQKK